MKKYCMNLSNIFTNKINIDYDLKCELECKLIDSLNSTFILKNITGSKKMELLGSNINEIDLNLLLADNFRIIHNNFITDILKHREKSKFWKLFTEGKMNRIVNIINPINKKEYGIKLNICFKSQNLNMIIFEVIFTDVSIVNNVINKTGLLTHDLRSIIKSAQNITKQLELEFDLKDKSEQFLTLKELLDEAYKMCSKSRTSLMVENVYRTESKLYSNVKLYLAIAKYVKKLSNIFPNIKFNLEIKSSLEITNFQNDTLWHLILNMVKNASNANSSTITIILNSQIETNQIEIYVKDNGIGMNSEQVKNFFSRKLPNELTNNLTNDLTNEQIPKLIDANRGEGFILSYTQWKNQGGSVKIIESNINKGTEFLITIEGINVNQYGLDNFVLNSLQLQLITSIYNIDKKYLIYIIDDNLLNLKILCSKIIKTQNKTFKYENFPILTQEEWQNIGYIKIIDDPYIFILVANGLYGKELITMIEPKIIITDIQMPGLNGIKMIKAILDDGNKSKIIFNSAYMESDDTEIIEIIKQNNILFVEKGNDFNWANIF